MADLKKKFHKPEDDGVWAEYEDAKILIVKPSSRKGTLLLQSRLNREEIDLLGAQRDPENQSDLKKKPFGEFLMLQAKLAAAYLLDWEGFTEDGVDVPFSFETAVQYCYEYKDFRLFIESEIVKLSEVEESKAEKADKIKKN